MLQFWLSFPLDTHFSECVPHIIFLSVGNILENCLVVGQNLHDPFCTLSLLGVVHIYPGAGHIDVQSINNISGGTGTLNGAVSRTIPGLVGVRFHENHAI